MLTLYQFPNSHYCEKIRWALAYKEIDCQIKNLLPGLHTITTNRLAPSSSLPILVDNGKAIQNSSTIITYLDKQFPHKPLTPNKSVLKQEALEWENFADETIGISVRTFCYHTLLDHPPILIPMFTKNGPWYGSWLIKAVFPKLAKVMRNSMNINAKTAKNAAQQLGDALDKLHHRLQDRQFLVGDQFSRADLAAAALLAPLCKPPKYGLDWPAHFPEPLNSLLVEYDEKLVWVNKLYQEYR